MTNPNKLPPDIEGIREMVAVELYEQRRHGNHFLIIWAKLSKTNKEAWRMRADIIFSKLTEHGVVVLVSGDKFGTNISTGNGYYEVVNLDGTPVKEGG